jgi:hypothetical protein
LGKHEPYHRRSWRAHNGRVSGADRRTRSRAWAPSRRCIAGCGATWAQVRGGYGSRKTERGMWSPLVSVSG